MTANRPTIIADQRQLQLQTWFDAQANSIAAQLGLSQMPNAQLTACSSDASFRRYFRWQADGHSLLLMDAPPPQENCAPFVFMAKLLKQHGLHVPLILAQDLEQGFLAISDLGQQTWLEYFQADSANLAQAQQLFPHAINCLLQLQQTPVADLQLPHYDEALLRRELELFPEWFIGYELGIKLNDKQQQLWQHCSQLLIDNALQQSQVLVHRDFMPRNLMFSQTNPGLIDFQDAVIGPISYDVVSLFKDAFISWPPQLVEQMQYAYWQQARELGLPVPASWPQFQRDCALIGAQRHLKVIGIFARICHRDGKPRYLADAKRFFGYLQQAIAQQTELAPLRQLLDSLPLEPYTA